MRLAIIADDITGAAEMAGTATRYGLRVKMVTQPHSLTDADVTVVATDTRSGNKEEARRTVEQCVNELGQQNDMLLFKKTDSALRGHIVEELATAMQCMGVSKCLLLPQNPSRQRTIENGIYYIKGEKLEETAFSYDPEFPASTSVVEQLKPGTRNIGLDMALTSGINIGDAATKEDLKAQLAKADGDTLLAGGADTLEVVLETTLSKKPSAEAVRTTTNKGKTLIVCGSTQSKPVANETFFKQIGAKENSMPDSVFEGEQPTEWIDELLPIYKESNGLIINMGYNRPVRHHYAARLRHVMAQVTEALTCKQKPDLMIIEGGATAFAILQQLRWGALEMKKELSPGVVCLTHNGTDIILKPGSYPWNFG